MCQSLPCWLLNVVLHEGLLRPHWRTTQSLSIVFADLASAPPEQQGRALAAASALALSLAKAMRQGALASNHSQASAPDCCCKFTQPSICSTHTCLALLQDGMFWTFSDPCDIVLALQRVPTPGVPSLRCCF